MIFDRTQTHVNDALKIRKEKLQNFQEITDDEKAILDRGFVTIDTLNRIENKTEELKNKFESDFYLVDKITVKNWGYTDYFNASEFDRILNNLDLLKKAYYIYSTTPNTPDAKYEYTVFNDLERGLYDLERMITDIHEHYRYCGEIECGGQTND